MARLGTQHIQETSRYASGNGIPAAISSGRMKRDRLADPVVLRCSRPSGKEHPDVESTPLVEKPHVIRLFVQRAGISGRPASVLTGRVTIFLEPADFFVRSLGKSRCSA